MRVDSCRYPMNVIQGIDNTLFKVFSFQNYAGDETYRLHNCCILTTCAGGQLFYNTLTCELLFIDEKELEDDETKEYLVKHWFLVPIGFDDRKFQGQALGILKLLNKKEEGIYNYTIFTTTDCNARCFYCFQKGRAHRNMSYDIADKVIEIIVHAYDSKLKSEGKSVLLQWFGGEPLYNSKIITYICTKLTEAGVGYHSYMISNGYLFSQAMAQEAHELWHLEKVQITLDGTGEVYNKVKNYIYKDRNPFRRILRNIDYLLANEINVKVRLNLDIYNSSNLKRLAKMLGQRFGGKKGFSCYGRALFEQEDKAFTHRTSDQRTMVFDELDKLQQILLTQGIANPPSLRKSPRLVFCKADSGDAITILPDGNIGLCDYYTESEFISHIDHYDVVDTTVKQNFKEHCEDLEICNDCPIHPQCIRLKKCGEENYCFTQYKEYRIQQVRNAMLAKYERWKANQDDEEEEVAEDC